MKHKNATKHMRKYREDKTFLTIRKDQSAEIQRIKNKYKFTNQMEVLDLLLTVYNKQFNI